MPDKTEVELYLEQTGFTGPPGIDAPQALDQHGSLPPVEPPAQPDNTVNDYLEQAGFTGLPEHVR